MAVGSTQVALARRGSGAVKSYPLACLLSLSLFWIPLGLLIWLLIWWLW